MISNETEEYEEAMSPKLWERIVATIGMAVLSLVGLVAYGVVFVILLKDRKGPAAKAKFNNSFYTMILSLGVSDSTMVVLFLFYSVPSTLVGYPLGGQLVNTAMGIVCNVAWFVVDLSTSRRRRRYRRHHLQVRRAAVHPLHQSESLLGRVSVLQLRARVQRRTHQGPGRSLLGQWSADQPGSVPPLLLHALLP